MVVSERYSGNYLLLEKGFLHNQSSSSEGTCLHHPVLSWQTAVWSLGSRAGGNRWTLRKACVWVRGTQRRLRTAAPSLGPPRSAHTGAGPRLSGRTPRAPATASETQASGSRVLTSGASMCDPRGPVPHRGNELAGTIRGEPTAAGSNETAKNRNTCQSTALCPIGWHALGWLHMFLEN